MTVGVHMSFGDFLLPYSSGKETARYIESKGWNDFPIFATRDTEVATVAGYLDREFYFPEIHDFGSYAQWGNRNEVNTNKILDEVSVFLDKFPEVEKLLLILSNRSAVKNLETGDKISFDKFTLKADKKFENSFHTSEIFHLYWVERRSK